MFDFCGLHAAHFRRFPCGSAITRGGTRSCDAIQRHISSAFSISRRSPSLLNCTSHSHFSQLCSHSHPLLVLTLILCFSSSLCSLFPSQSRPAILKKKNHWTCRSSFVAVSLWDSSNLSHLSCCPSHRMPSRAPHVNINSRSNSCSSASSLTSQTEQLSQLLESFDPHHASPSLVPPRSSMLSDVIFFCASAMSWWGHPSLV